MLRLVQQPQRRAQFVVTLNPEVTELCVNLHLLGLQGPNRCTPVFPTSQLGDRREEEASGDNGHL